MPTGLVSKGDFRRGTDAAKESMNEVTWAQSPAEFGNPIDEPTDFGNKVTWSPSPGHFGNSVGGSAATPTFDPLAGTYGVPQFVHIVSPGADAIYFTLDGSTPDTTSELYQGNVFIPSSLTLKAISVVDGTPSSAGSAVYVIL